jgi:hypothetical protein
MLAKGKRSLNLDPTDAQPLPRKSRTAVAIGAISTSLQCPSSSTPSSAAELPDSTTVPVGTKIRQRTRPMYLTTGMLVGGKYLKSESGYSDFLTDSE